PPALRHRHNAAHRAPHPNPLVVLYRCVFPSGNITKRAHAQANRTQHRPRTDPLPSNEQPPNSSNASPHYAPSSASTTRPAHAAATSEQSATSSSTPVSTPIAGQASTSPKP